jgi:hypothetical protein
LTVVAQKNCLTSAGLQHVGTYAKLTIEGHASLELVGLTAILVKALADNEISENVIAAYYHHHIFVSFDIRQNAIDTLLALKQ